MGYVHYVDISGHPIHEIDESLTLLDALSALNGIPRWALSHLTLARRHSEWRDDIEVSATGKSSNKLPIAVCSHGLYGW